MKITIITLIPEAIKPYLDASMMWKATNKDLVQFKLVNLRDFGIGPRKQVDDTIYGGGDGMLLKPEPIFNAVEYAKRENPDSKVILMTPRGKNYTQKDAQRLAEEKSDLIIICARYEGYDERIVSIVDEQYSVGRYIVTGGELPALVLTDSVVRLIPGVLGGQNSALDESFSEGDNLEYPQYTRPDQFAGISVPEVLLSGDHGAIDKWRKKMSGTQKSD